MKPRKTGIRNRRKLTLLGGSVLFGYLGCQSPGSGSAGPVPPAGRDSVAADTLKIVARPLPGPVTGPLIERDGPTPGEACSDFGACMRDGTILMCRGGIREAVHESLLSGSYCIPGDTVIKSRHIGFTGIDKAGPRREPSRVLRRTLA